MTDTRLMHKTGWKCERCLNAGTVEYVVGSGVYEVLHLIEDAHAEESAGFCRVDTGKMRVWEIPALTDALAGATS